MPTVLTSEQAQTMLAKPTSVARGGKRKAKTIDRTYHAWFHDTGLQKLATCSNPDCCAPTIEEGGTGPHRMTAEVDNLIMCRFCFLAGYGQPSESALTESSIRDTT